MVVSVALGPIGQISRQVRDIEAAVEWYRDVLGLPHASGLEEWMAFFEGARNQCLDNRQQQSYCVVDSLGTRH